MYFEMSGHELQIFSYILEEAFHDHYVRPSNEWADLPVKELKKEFPLFLEKKKQAQIFLKQELGELHFGYEPAQYPGSSQSPSLEQNDVLFQAVSKVLGVNSKIQNQLDLKRAFAALRWELEMGGRYIPKKIQNLFEEVRTKINPAYITQWDKKDIVVQAIAQIFGYCSGQFNITKIKSEILNLSDDLKELLWLGQWTSQSQKMKKEDVDPKDRARSIERNIASVNPIFKSKRRGRTNKSSGEILLIPGIFKERNGVTIIHFKKLRIALSYLSISLVIKNKSSYQEIIEHPVILKYLEKLPGFLHPYCTDVWIAHALHEMADFLP